VLFDFLRDRETIRGLRKELRELRVELERKDLAQHEFRDWKKGFGVVWKEHVASVAHFNLTEPRIQSRKHSDVFKIASIDALIEGTSR